MRRTSSRTGWQSKRTAETRRVEDLLRRSFETVDAYRYNPAAIRVRVVDSRFEGKSDARRYAVVDKLLRQLPAEIEGDIMNLLVFAPSELEEAGGTIAANVEFEHPSPWRL